MSVAVFYLVLIIALRKWFKKGCIIIKVNYFCILGITFTKTGK